MSEPPTNPESTQTQNEASTSAKKVAEGVGSALINTINKSLDIVNATTDATQNIAKNAIGTTTKVTESALSIAEKSGKIAEEVANIGLIAAQQSSEHIGKTAGEGAKSLSIIAQTANSILGTVQSIAERTQNAIEDANKRRKLLNEETLEFMQKSSKTNIESNVEKEKLKLEKELTVLRSTSQQASDLEIAKNKAKIDLEIATINSDLESKLTKLEFERKEAAKKANELKDELDRAQVVYNATNDEMQKNNYITFHNYGYQTPQMTYKGRVKSRFFPDYYYCYKIVKITNKNDKTNYIVDFELSQHRQLYFLRDNSEIVYYLNTNNLLSNNIPGNLIKTEDGNPLFGEDVIFDIEVEKIWVKTQKKGGRKTRRINSKNRRQIKNKRKTTRRTRK